MYDKHYVEHNVWQVPGRLELFGTLSSNRVTLKCLEVLALTDAFRCVELEEGGRGPSFGSEANNARPFQAKVVRPAIPPRMKQAYDLSRGRIH